ncbi:MAG: cysteine synthase family protein [Anaerolineae bacterium]|nr:cysteine synthase family protein [Anaerolineae bacterium]
MTTLQQPKMQSTISELGGLGSHVGNTPLLPLRKVSSSTPNAVDIFVKAEWLNPGGSVKDRPALSIIQTAISNGDLQPGVRLLDSTSGNMGIAYATFCAALDIPLTLTLPENASPERIMMLNALGAELVLTDPLESSDGAILVARELVNENPELYWYANQYDNPANSTAHYRTTGPEIWEQTAGRVTHFVSGLGTSGTMMGTGRYLREKNPNVQLIAFQPDSALHGLEGLKHMGSAIKPGIYDEHFADRVLEVSTEDSREMVLRLAREEGLFVGISSGAAVVASLKLASELDSGYIVTIFPDSGYKYLSDLELWKGN